MGKGRKKEHSVLLAGDWTVEKIAEQRRFLAKAETSMKKEPDLPLAVDAGGVASIDTCGCQLLALWLRDVKQRGGRVKVKNITQEMFAYVSLLGFGGELTAE